MTTARVIRRILSARELQVSRAELAWKALRLFEQGKADFSDYLIGLTNQREKADTTFTFDRQAAESELFQMVPD